MRGACCALLLLLAGCLAPEEAPPWRSGGRIALFDDAVKDAAGDNMKMGGSPTRRGPLAPPSLDP